MGIVGLIIAGAAYAYKAMQGNRVFISFDYSEDLELRNLLEAWDKNSSFNFSMQRTSPMKAIRSEDEAVVKRALTPMLKKAEYLLVIVGWKTANSNFVQWEIERAMAPDVNLKIAAVKRHPHCILPDILRHGRSSWSPNFTVHGINKALKEANRLY